MWILGWKYEMCAVESSYNSHQHHAERGSQYSCRTAIELAVIGDHKHDLPLENVVFHQPATYARYILIALHLLELPAQ